MDDKLTTLVEKLIDGIKAGRYFVQLDTADNEIYSVNLMDLVGNSVAMIERNRIYMDYDVSPSFVANAMFNRLDVGSSIFEAALEREIQQTHEALEAALVRLK